MATIAQSYIEQATNGEQKSPIDKADKKKKKAPKKPQDKNTPQRDDAGRFLHGNSIAAKWTEEAALKLGQELIEWMNEAEANFWLKDFLIEKELYADVIGYLSDKYPRFCDYIARAKEIEASRIQKFALMNQLNTGMAQWVLSVHHDQHNVQKQEITGKDGSPIAPPTIMIQPVKVKED